MQGKITPTAQAESHNVATATAKPAKTIEPAPIRTATAEPAQPVKDKPAAPTKLASIERPAAPNAIAKPKASEADDPASPAVARSIAAVQQSLAVCDLASARRHMRSLRVNEPRSPEIQQLAAELSRQERARDAALANARSCSFNKDASCAIRNTRRAAALDTRSPQAQAVLRQAMAVQNEANTEYFYQASAVPGAPVPSMTFDGRWSATHGHASSSSQSGERSSYTLFGWGVPTVAKGRGDAH